MMATPSLDSISAQLALISAKQDTAATVAAANAVAVTRALESLSADTKELVLKAREVTKQNRITVLGPLLRQYAGTWDEGVRTPCPVQADSFYDIIKPLVDPNDIKWKKVQDFKNMIRGKNTMLRQGLRIGDDGSEELVDGRPSANPTYAFRYISKRVCWLVDIGDYRNFVANGWPANILASLAILLPSPPPPPPSPPSPPPQPPTPPPASTHPDNYVTVNHHGHVIAARPFNVEDQFVHSARTNKANANTVFYGSSQQGKSVAMRKWMQAAAPFVAMRGLCDEANKFDTYCEDGAFQATTDKNVLKALFLQYYQEARPKTATDAGKIVLCPSEDLMDAMKEAGIWAPGEVGRDALGKGRHKNFIKLDTIQDWKGVPPMIRKNYRFIAITVSTSVTHTLRC